MCAARGALPSRRVGVVYPNLEDAADAFLLNCLQNLPEISLAVGSPLPPRSVVVLVTPAIDTKVGPRDFQIIPDLIGLHIADDAGLTAGVVGEPFQLLDLIEAGTPTRLARLKRRLEIRSAALLIVHLN